MDVDLAGVGKVDNLLHRTPVDVRESDVLLFALQHVVGEHGTEVLAACGENEAMGGDVPTADTQNYVAEMLLASQAFHLRQEMTGVSFGGEWGEREGRRFHTREQSEMV